MDNNKNHRLGKIWMAGSVIMMLSIPFFTAIIMRASVDWKAFFSISVFWTLLALYLPTAIGEIFLYSNMLGTDGMYIAFVTGNLSNLKIPCVINAREIVGTEIGSEENEIASTISIAVSSIVTVLIIAIGVFLLSISGLSAFLESESSVFLKPAFGAVTYALFGALGGKYLVKYPKVAVIPFLGITILCVTLVLIGGGNVVSTGNMLFVGVIACYFNARRLYYKKCKLEQEQANNN